MDLNVWMYMSVHLYENLPKWYHMAYSLRISNLGEIVKTNDNNLKV